MQEFVGIQGYELVDLPIQNGDFKQPIIYLLYEDLYEGESC